MFERFRWFLIFLLILIFLFFGIEKLLSHGLVPFKFTSPTLQTNQTRVVVSEENAVIDVVEKSSPSVVAIGVSQRIINPFNNQSGQNQQNTIGTGFVVSGQGVIVTNRHVVEDTSLNYSVVTKDGKRLEVTKIYRDPFLDLALVSIKESGLKALELGDSDKLKTGQTVIAIGNALGEFNNTVTTGVVSGQGRAVAAGDQFGGNLEQLNNLIQTDAAINPGNSGGPLLNSAGQVIGVNVATSAGAQNIGFAIPINQVKSIIDEFIQRGTVDRPYLGIKYQIVGRDLAILNNIPQGAYIQEVVAGSPAEKAGITAGDIITKVNNTLVNGQNQISDSIRNKKIGDTLSLEIWVDGNTKNITVTLESAPQQ